MTIIMSIGNQKGGVGKTTTTINLGAALGRLGKRVLLVDLDQQASLTECFIDLSEVEKTVYDLLVPPVTKEEQEAPVVIPPLQIAENIFLLPATIELAGAEIELPKQRFYERRLALRLRPYLPKFDVILLDLPPSLSVLTTVGLGASHRILVPVEPETMALRTIPLIMDTISEVVDSELNVDLKIWHILPTQYNSRLAHHNESMDILKELYGDQVYPEPVKLTTKYKDAINARADVSILSKEEGQYWETMARKLVGV